MTAILMTEIVLLIFFLGKLFLFSFYNIFPQVLSSSLHKASIDLNTLYLFCRILGACVFNAKHLTMAWENGN